MIELMEQSNQDYKKYKIGKERLEIQKILLPNIHYYKKINNQQKKDLIIR